MNEPSCQGRTSWGLNLPQLELQHARSARLPANDLYMDMDETHMKTKKNKIKNDKIGNMAPEDRASAWELDFPWRFTPESGLARTSGSGFGTENRREHYEFHIRSLPLIPVETAGYHPWTRSEECQMGYFQKHPALLCAHPQR